MYQSLYGTMNWWTQSKVSEWPASESCVAVPPLIKSYLCASRYLPAFCSLVKRSLRPPQTPHWNFPKSVRPLLLENCGTCHNPGNPANRVDFLKASTVQDVESRRGLWHNVAAQLRNRTMPPVASKLSEDDRLRIALWIDNELRQTACSGGNYAGASAFRRLNRREYHNTIRDLLGIDYDVALVFPSDGTGGSGFDTNG